MQCTSVCTASLHFTAGESWCLNDDLPASLPNQTCIEQGGRPRPAGKTWPGPGCHFYQLQPIMDSGLIHLCMHGWILPPEAKIRTNLLCWENI